MWMKHNNYVIPKIYMVFGWIIENDVFIDVNKKVAAIFLNFSGALDRGVSYWKLLQIMKCSLFKSLDCKSSMVLITIKKTSTINRQIMIVIRLKDSHLIVNKLGMV